MSEPKLHPIVNNPRRYEAFLLVGETKFYANLLGPFLHHVLMYRQADEILSWLIRHNFRGNNLYQEFQYKYKGSPMATVQWVLKEINKEKEIKAVIVGKDYLG